MDTADQSIPTPTPDPQSARERFKAIRDYVIYYGVGRADRMEGFDLAIVQPETLAGRDLPDLKARGVLVIVYLSVGEAEPWRPWWAKVDPAWLLGKNENWGSYYVDTRQPGWQKLIIEQAGMFLAAGYDGLFLDTVDTAERYWQTRSGMIALIEGLRSAYPDALLVQNRGFNLAPSEAGVIDGLMAEGLSTSYDFTNKTYRQIDNPALASRLTQLREQTGVVILSLDYAAPEDKAGAARAVQIAREYGFIPAVSVILLNDIPDYGVQ